MSAGPTTTLGTPRAQTWDDAWFAFVDETEQRLERRICGAHAPDGEPCELGSTHPNGRCRFHGGHPRIGGQPGNRNALVHGLYSRRLRQCDHTCPLWRACPFAGADVMALNERKRPVCAYEAEAYAVATGTEPPAVPSPEAAAPTRREDAAGAQAVPPETKTLTPQRKQQLKTMLYRHSRLPPGPGQRKTPDEKTTRPSDAAVPEIPLGRQDVPNGDPVGDIVEDTGAILYAMLQRATLTLSAYALTDRTEAEGERYWMRTTKVSAALTAFLRIARELRAWLRLAPGPGDDDAADADRPYYDEQGRTIFYDASGQALGFPDIMRPFLEELDIVVDELRRDGIRLDPP